MNLPRILVILLFLALLGAPLLFRTGEAARLGEGAPLIIITPHNEQIRFEFGQAFERWHQREYGEPVRVVWSTPGGTSEIRRMLQAQYAAQLRDDQPLGGNADLVFGGGEFEHAELKNGVTVIVNGETRRAAITEPIAFTEEELHEFYSGRTHIGTSPFYDAEGYWFGTALSGFGLVYNRDMLASINVHEPRYWQDLCHPALLGWVALGNPGQSGSIRKSFDTVLQRRGWVEGWRILRRASANARYFSASASKIPIDVSQGDAAIGVSIDFYGRYQAQAIRDAGDPDRVGYVDPPGESAIDADPVSMLRGAPNPELAQRFIRFTLSEAAQVLWQYPARPGSAGSPGDPGDDSLEEDREQFHPRRYALRRMPIRPSVYESPLFDGFVDRVNLFEQYDRPETALILNRDYWDFVPLLMSSLAMENHHRLIAAWRAIITHPAFPAGDNGLVRSEEIEDSRLRRMIELFDELPAVPGPDGAMYSLGNVEHLGAIRRGWLRGEWKDAGLWPAEANPRDVLRVRLTKHFRENYERIIRLADE